VGKLSDSPGVRFPPPFLYAAAVVGGWLLNKRWPLPTGHASIASIVGAGLAAAALALALASMGRFWRSKTSISPNRPAAALVISGPYRFTRNPMYVGMAMLTVALALILGTWWPVILLVPTLMVLQRLVIVREERYLQRRFPGEYERYMRQVRRWL
jgi:protein-S-isoprenylcysteine O-methyltransferase Ste14